MNLGKLFIPIVLGTGRRGRESLKVADFVLKEIKKQEQINSEIIDVSDFKRIFTERYAPEYDVWKDKADRADGFILVFPEYNRSYPGELKIFLDSLTKEYAKKPVALCGVSSGLIGGARAVELIKPVLIDLKMVIVPRSIYFPNIGRAFNEDGSVVDILYEKKAEELFKDLIWYARTLKYGREVIN